MAKIEQLNPYLEVKQSTNRDIRQVGVLVSAKYIADSTASQTVINLNFTIGQTDEQKRGFQLFIDGRLLSEGISNDFTFTNIVSGVSAQVTLNSPIIAGLDIQAYKLGAYQESYPNASSVTATLNNDVAQPNLMALAGFQPFVKRAPTSVAVTTIVNRLAIDNQLKPIAGPERIHTKSISLLRSEFGANGEQVWELDNKDSRVRFVGSAWVSSNTADGGRIVAGTAVTGDYVEITFYGTALNVLTYLTTTLPTVLMTVDGGTEAVTTIFPSGTISTIIGGRNAFPNQVVALTSGLALGWHTVKLRISATGASGFNVGGFEVINERSTLAVLSGIGYGGTKQETLAALSATSFSAGVSGSRGARIVKYLLNGAISQVVQEVNGASAFLSSADHTNEEVIRKLNFRDFGANLAADFTTLAGSTADAYYTLEDGTTTLSGNQVAMSSIGGREAINTNSGATTDFFALTFVGTGVDLTLTSANATRSYEYSIDSSVVGSITGISDSVWRTYKIASGLPYGTHTLKIRNNTAATGGMSISDFTIYQPKKPTLPSGAIEVADYNLMGTYTANTVAGFGTIARGVLRKAPIKEVNYINSGGGVWAVNPVVSAIPLGVAVQGNSTAGYSLEYTFYGTGFEFRYYRDTNTRNVTFTLDGSTNFSGFTTSIYIGSGTSTFTAATGILNDPGGGGNSFDEGVAVSGLTYGKHTLRITRNSGTGAFNPCAFDIVTPIHMNDSSLKVGSTALNDSRAFSPVVDKPEKIDLTKVKAWMVYDGVNSKILASFGVSAVLRAGTGDYTMYLEKPFRDANWVCVAGQSTAQVSLNSSTDGGSLKGKSLQRFLTSNSAGTSGDGVVNLMCIGELEDEGEI